MADVAKASSPKLPWKIKVAVILFLLISKIVRPPDSSVNRRIINLLEPKCPPSNNPIHGVRSADFTVDPARNLFIPTATDGSGVPMIVFFHGGGFVFGYADSVLSDGSWRSLAAGVNAIDLSVNYRLAQDHRFPCQYDDGFDALNFIGEKCSDYFAGLCDPAQCSLMGESACGNLAHHVVVRALEYEFKQLKIEGLVAIQPFFGREERTESELRFRKGPVLSLDFTDWYWQAFLPVGSDWDHTAANVVGPNAAEISTLKLPATILIVGEWDLLQDRQRSYFEALNKAGREVKLVEYPKTVHVFSVVPELPEYGSYVTEV